MLLLLPIITSIILFSGSLFAAPAEKSSINGGGVILEGDNKISFGGNVKDIGGSFKGQWQINFHNVGNDILDKGKFHSTEIVEMNFYDGTNSTCATAMNFTAMGKWNGIPGYKLIFRAGDADDPKGLDTVRIEIRSPGGSQVYDTHDEDFTDESNCVGNARTGLDKGNIKINF